MSFVDIVLYIGIFVFACTGALKARTHQIGVYGLGKCQRLIALLREAGYDRPIWLHGALRAMGGWESSLNAQFRRRSR